MKEMGRGRKSSAHKLPPDGALDQRARIRHAVKLDEAAEAWALGLAEQYLVERREPGAQRLEGMHLADGVDDVLQLFSAGVRLHFGELRRQRLQRLALMLRRQPVSLRRLHEVVVIAQRVADQMIEHGVLLRRGAGRILS